VQINPDDGITDAASIIDGTASASPMAEPIHIPGKENVF